MQIDNNSEWVESTLELMKCIEATGSPIIDEEKGYINYLSSGDNYKKLIRILVDEKKGILPAYVETIKDTIEEINEKKYDEVVILTDRITKAAYDLVIQHDNIGVITPKMKRTFSSKEVLLAIQKKTKDLCKIKCGKIPEKIEECIGEKGSKYECDLLRLNTDATFHANMKWNDVLFEDFYNLCELEKTLTE